MEQLRKDGNELFKCGDYEGALTAYTQALGLGATAEDQAVLHRNLAACHLKLVREPLPLPAVVCPPRHRGAPGRTFTFSGHTHLWDVLGLQVVGDQVILETNSAAQLVPRKEDEQAARLLFFLLQEDYNKAEAEASKGRECAQCGAVGLLWWARILGPLHHHVLLLPPETRLPSFPLPRAFPFLQLPSPFPRLKC